jgi:flagellin-like hook-associated protein FlgL
MADVTLSGAVRQSLLSLQSTSSLIERTQNRLSTGLKVAGPIDDPVAYFQAKSLDDRASDFTEKKDAIDQGISIVSAALDGVTAVENLVRQLKGLANSLKSATGTQFTDLVAQFNDIRNQINYLTTDASYQGTNLINGTGESLAVEFSQLSQSKLTVASVDLTNASQGLSVGDLNSYTGDFQASYAVSTALTVGTQSVITGSASITFTWEGASKTYSSGDTIAITYGTTSYTVVVGSGGDYTLENGDTFTVDVATGGQTGFYIVGDIWSSTGAAAVTYSVATADAVIGSGDSFVLTWHGASRTLTTSDTLTVRLGLGTGTEFTFSVGTKAGSGNVVNLVKGCTFTIDVGTAFAGTSSGSTHLYTTTAQVGTAGGELTLDATTGAKSNYSQLTQGNIAIVGTDVSTAQTKYSNYVAEGDTTSINSVITELDASLATLRSEGSKLGSNVALLKTRLDFTDTYVNTLTDGAGKLTLADLNSEGANLLALQTRQSLGIQALSFAGQAEQGILRLFG